MAFMTWSDDLVTGIEVVDRQHRHLVDMINHAAQLLLEAPAAEPEQKTDKLFADLMDYAATHFHTEEALMAARGVDARVLAHHHRTHQDFVQQITSMARQFRAGELNSDGLLGYLAGWLLFHTLGEDQTMSRQVHAIENGVDPARAYQDAEGGRLEPEQNALARTMVTLYTQLSGQIRELDLYSQRLEELVDERTAHLNAMTDDLAKARDAAEAGSRAKSRFIGAISHELRTPMNAVLGLARVLQGAPLQTNQSGLVRNIVDSSEHLLKLINDVIEYARIDSGSDEVQAVSFDLRAGLDEACASGFEVARSKGIDCRLEVDAALPPQCVGDVRRLVSALRQFVDNAAKFTERGAIRVRAERLGAEKDRVQVRFGVRDSGIGIAPEQQNLLFQVCRHRSGPGPRTSSGSAVGGWNRPQERARQRQSVLVGYLAGAGRGRREARAAEGWGA
jgi:hemerythrin-like metal-binding protein